MDHRRLIITSHLPPMQKPRNTMDPGLRACVIIPGIALLLYAIGASIYNYYTLADKTLEATRIHFEDIAMAEGRYHNRHGRYGTIDEIWPNRNSIRTNADGELVVSFGINIHMELQDGGRHYLASCSYGGKQMRMDDSGEMEIVPVE